MKWPKSEQTHKLGEGGEEVGGFGAAIFQRFEAEKKTAPWKMSIEVLKP